MRKKLSFDEQLKTLNEDEQAIMHMLLNRLLIGKKTYGSWHVRDNRDYSKEALEEVIDSLHYCAAHLVRLSKIQGGMK